VVIYVIRFVLARFILILWLDPLAAHSGSLIRLKSSNIGSAKCRNVSIVVSGYSVLARVIVVEIAVL
jgi:hypothetical protein